MKKQLLLPLLALAVIFTGCKKDDGAETASISLEKTAYTLKDSPVTIKLKSTYKGTAADVPFTLTGTAVKDVDYTISADKFVVGGSSQVLEITISPKEYYSEGNKELVLTLGSLPGGVDSGNTTATITVEPRSKTIVSFTVRNTAMSANATITVALYDLNGNKYYAEEEIAIPLKVDENAANTAVLGEHFSFNNGAQLVIPKGKSEGSLSVGWLKTEIDKDVFYLTLDWGNKFTAGQYDQIKVTILGSYGDKIAGEWALYKEVTDKQYFDDTWGSMLTTNGFGAADPTDKIIIEGNSFKTEMASFYKDYFAASAEFTLGNELSLRVGYNDTRTLQLLALSGVNRYFSPTEKSDDDVALLGVRVFNDPDNESVEILDLYIIDYEPKAFFQEFVEFGLLNPTKPKTTMSGGFINVQYSKVK